MLKNLVKILFSLIVIPTAIAGSFWYLDDQNFFNLTDLDFKTDFSRDKATEKSEKSILGNEISTLSEKLQSFKGVSLFKVDLEKIQKTIESENWVKSVEIYREWPNRLKIVIDAYDISLLFWQSDKKIFPILENNKILAPLEIGQAPDRAITVERKIFAENKVREKAIKLVKSLPPRGSFSSSKISEIGFNPKEGFWMDILNKELRVKLGSENFESKSIRVSQVLDYIENKQIEARVIDANLSQKVLVRLRKDP
jgi:cell division protein FtsQ